MKQTPEQIKERLEFEAERQKRSEWHGTIWRPTITEREAAERAKQVANGTVPF